MSLGWREEEGMKGYEGCYYCEYESKKEGANEHSDEETNRAEESRCLKDVSCFHLVIGGDGTGKKKDARRN